MTDVADPYITFLKREATRPLVYQPGISPIRYFEMLSRLEVQIEFSRLNSDEPKMVDQLFVKLVRYVAFLQMLAPIKNSSSDASRAFGKKLELAQTFITEAEQVKASIISRMMEHRRLQAEEAARAPAVEEPEEDCFMGQPPDAPSAPSAPPLAPPDASQTPSCPSAQHLVHPCEPPEEPPPPTIESFSAQPQLETKKDERVYKMAADLHKRFLQAAWSNTEKGIETCGILVGDIKDNTIIIDTILMPPQTGSYNTCEALDEMQVSTWQIEHGRISVGWIHTHPTQEAFLSSIDLHTHFSYQSLQPEALALVCAPTDAVRKLGKFRISDYGMEYLKTCNRTTGFHPHDDATGPLFEEVKIQVEESIKLELVDFRESN